MKPSPKVMKFGGTAVADADGIRRAATIVHSAAKQHPVVVVVSAMSGVTNRLVQAAHRAEHGEQDFIAQLISELSTQHNVALDALVSDIQDRGKVAVACKDVLDELERLLRGTSMLRELTPRALDVISGI